MIGPFCLRISHFHPRDPFIRLRCIRRLEVIRDYNFQVRVYIQLLDPLLEHRTSWRDHKCWQMGAFLTCRKFFDSEGKGSSCLPCLAKASAFCNNAASNDRVLQDSFLCGLSFRRVSVAGPRGSLPRVLCITSGC